MKGKIHPITQIIRESERVFNSLGYEVYLSDELTSSYDNFDSLNIPEDHPARDLWDTFYLDEPVGDLDLMRTHTSNSEVDFLKKNGVPSKVIVPGKTFRNEATDATHEAQFHQLEGFYVDKGVTLGSLKKTLTYFVQEMLGKDTEVRFRPGYFPFVEPGIEVDVSCIGCSGKGCSICKNTGWIELLGAGMLHPNVLRNAGVDPDEYSGLAFGIGIDRLAMLKYGINDVRLGYKGDVRFLNQF